MNKQLIKESLSFYYELNSESHGFKHLDEVFELAMEIKEKLGLDEIPDKAIMAAAYTHDMFSSINREHHHELGKRWVEDTNIFFLNELAPHERHAVACAVGEHRASYKGEYTTVLSELISAADRGKPDKNKIISRVYQCAMEPDSVFKYDDEEELAKNGLTHKLGLSRTVKHLKDKYSSTGYARYNSIYEEMFGETLNEMRVLFDDITEADVEEILKTIEVFDNTYARGNESIDEAAERVVNVHNDK